MKRTTLMVVGWCLACGGGTTLSTRPADWDAVLTAADVLGPAGYPVEAGVETLDRTVYGDGHAELIYEYLPVQGPSVRTELGFEADADLAHAAYIGIQYGNDAAASLVGPALGITRAAAPELLTWGDERECGRYTNTQGAPYGGWCIARKADKTLFVEVIGVPLAEGAAFDALLAEPLAELDGGYDPR